MISILDTHKYTPTQLIIPKIADGGVKRCVLIFSCKNSKITTHCWTTVNRGMLDPTKKRCPTAKGKGEGPSKTVGEVKSPLESNPISARGSQRDQTNLVCTRTQRPHRDWARSVSECLLQRSGSAVACCRGKGSGCSRRGYGISPPGGGHH